MSKHVLIIAHDLEYAVSNTYEALSFLGQVSDHDYGGEIGLDLTSNEEGVAAIFRILANYLGNAIYRDKEEEKAGPEGGGS